MNRKYIMALLSAMLILPFFSCEDTSEMVMEETPIVAYTSVRSPQEAMEIALNANSMLMESSKQTRSANKVRTIDDDQNPIIVRQEAARLTRSAFSSDTLLYIFNYSNNDGFAIVSANRSTEGLLAVADSGHIESITNIENPGLAMFVERAQDYVRAFPDTTFHPDEFIRMTRDTLLYHVIEPKLGNMKCRQSGLHESKYCPNGSVGCGPLAVFMSMVALKYPNSISLTYDERDLNSITMLSYKWEDVMGHFRTPCNCDEDDVSTSEYLNNTGRICREIGNRCNSGYDLTDSATYTYDRDLVIGTRSFGLYVSSFYSYSTNCIRDSLNNNNIIILSAKNSEHDGHVWVVDGCKYYKITENTYQGSGLDWRLVDTMTKRASYDHYNWGWGGTNNGYYYSGVFDYNNPYHIDNDSKTRSNSPSDFSNNVRYAVLRKRTN